MPFASSDGAGYLQLQTAPLNIS